MAGAEGPDHVGEHAVIMRVAGHSLLDVAHLSGAHLIEQKGIVDLVVEADEVGARLEQQVDVALVLRRSDGQPQPIVRKRILERAQKLGVRLGAPVRRRRGAAGKYGPVPEVRVFARLGDRFQKIVGTLGEERIIAANVTDNKANSCTESRYGASLFPECCKLLQYGKIC